MPNVAHAAGGGNDRRSHTAEEAAAGVRVAMDAWPAAAGARHPISRCIIGHRVRRQSYETLRLPFVALPQHKRTGAFLLIRHCIVARRRNGRALASAP
jgi:hypothetical protein